MSAGSVLIYVATGVAAAIGIGVLVLAVTPWRLKLEKSTVPAKTRWSQAQTVWLIVCGVVVAGGAGLVAANAPTSTAIIGAGSGFAGGYFPQNSSATAAAAASLNVSFASPTSHILPTGEVFSGRVQGLGPGQTIWLFSKQITNPSGPITSGVIVPNQSPCDASDTTWSCLNVGIGGSHLQDNGVYQVWVAVLDPWQVREIQNDLVHNNSVVPGDEPPHANGGINSETVTRLP